MRALLTFIFILLLPALASSAVIFSDDFESDSSSWTCSNGQLSKWSDGWMYCGTTSGFGAEWKMGTGHNGGNAVYSWKKSGVPNDYRSESQRWLTGGELHQEIYNRWYMKVPTASAYNKSIASAGMKFWRYLGSMSGSPPELYLEAEGSTFASGNLTIRGDNTEHLVLAAISDFNDNNWHCHELRIKWNDQGQSNGIIEYWLDGVPTASYTNLNIASESGMVTTRVSVGIGNVSAEDWDQTEWSAIAFDDFVVSTTYIGEIGGSDTTSPSTTISTGDPTAISSDTLTVSGSSTDAVGVSGCKWRLGGAPTSSAGTSCTGTTSFSCSTSGYSSGANALHVACYDAAGIYGDDSITVNYTPPAGSGITPGNLILSESFEDSSFSSRNWYDGGSTDIVSGGQSGNCLRWAWTSGGSTPASMTTMRRQFTAQNKVLVRAYLKLDANWQGLQETYGGPHVMHVMGTVDGLYDGLSYADLNTYIEFYTNVGSPYTTYTRFQMQDSERIVTSPTPPTNLVSSTETRAVAGCNGDQGDAGSIVSCWEDGGDWFNGRIWDNTSAAVLKNEWVLVDTYMEMNTISNSVANANGKVRQWVNGTLVKSSDTVVFRTGDQPTKQFDKLILAPFMGSSPITQTMWVDELKIYDGYTSGAGAQIGSGGASFGSGGGSFR